MQRVARRKGHSAAAEVLAGRAVLEPLAAAVRTTNHDREMNDYSALPAPFEGRNPRGRTAHRTPPAGTQSAKNESTRARISTSVRAVWMSRRKSLPFLTPCVKKLANCFIFPMASGHAVSTRLRK